MKKHVLIIFTLLLCGPSFSQSAPGEIEKAARAFITVLDTAQRRQACFSWNEEERFNWHFVPRARKGLPLKEMTEAQRSKAYVLLKTCLSSDGYKKATAIVETEHILRALEGRGADDGYRDPGKYYFSFFGEPASGKPWGWRMEGHHLSLNFSAADRSLITGTPAFMGANPAIVPDGPQKGKQILKEESLLAFDLLKSFNSDQLSKAVIDEKAPADIITGNKRKAWRLDPPGLGYAELQPAQQQLLKKLVAVYVDRYTKLMADLLWKEITAAGWANLHFAWAGGKSWGTGHYYRIQGPTFIIEYDNTQNNANHVHTTFRDLKNDFGEDVLLQHYKQGHAKVNAP